MCHILSLHNRNMLCSLSIQHPGNFLQSDFLVISFVKLLKNCVLSYTTTREKLTFVYISENYEIMLASHIKLTQGFKALNFNKESRIPLENFTNFSDLTYFHKTVREYKILKWKKFGGIGRSMKWGLGFFPFNRSLGSIGVSESPEEQKNKLKGKHIERKQTHYLDTWFSETVLSWGNWCSLYSFLGNRHIKTPTKLELIFVCNIK